MKPSDLYNNLINASFDDGWECLRKAGFVRTAPYRIGSGHTTASAYGIIEGYYQAWVYRSGQWILTHSWEAVPGRLYGRPDAQVGILEEEA